MSDRYQEIEKLWPEISHADARRNGGSPIELMSAQAYADYDGMSLEDYIIKVLRAERDERQKQDRVVRDGAQVDLLLARAAAAGMPLIDYIVHKFGHGRGTGGLNPDFLAVIIRRMEELNSHG